MGRWIGEKLNACTGPVRLLIPEKGISALDIEGGPFWNPEADAALFRPCATRSPTRRASCPCRFTSTTRPSPKPPPTPSFPS
jgi:uncharacterized protein (UPF0261 family)